MSAVQLSMPKKIEPLFVKVQDGVTHIIARVGEVLLYIETTASGVAGGAKAWVIGKSTKTYTRIAELLEPVQANVNLKLQPLIAKLDSAVQVAKSKTMAVVTPVQVKVHDGIVYVQTFVGDTYVAISAKASSTWTKSMEYKTIAYDATFGALTRQVVSVQQRTYAVASEAKLRVYNALEPSLMRAKDGCLYIQTSIGNTVLRIKVGVQTQQSRIAAFAHRVGANVSETLHNLTAPVIERVVAIYEKVRSQLMAVCGPYLERLDGVRSTVTAKVGDVFVAMKVRTASARELAMKYPNMYYVKVKGGCVYLYSIVGDKVVAIKLQLQEIAAKVNAAVVKLSLDTQSQFAVIKDTIRSNALVGIQNAKGAASDRGVQATAAGSMAGSAALGASGGATGLATGSMVGAAIGLVPAVFTFGLSIPIGAAIGGTTGLVAGTVVGGTAGFIGGGLAGRTGYKNKDQIGNGVAAVATKAGNIKALVKERSSEALDQISGKVNDYKSAIVGQPTNAAMTTAGGA